MKESKTTSPKHIDINEYDYPLPEGRIAKYPLPERDASRLLLYRGGDIGKTVFRELPDHLPEGALLLFNNTRVIHARLPFRRATGARIEVFCLEPMTPAIHLQSLASTDPVTWKCLIGNNKRWKEEELVLPIDTGKGTVRLSARRLGRVEDAFAVRFHWDVPEMSFGEVLHAAGLIPLPPYLHRDNKPEDERRYQTVYARHEGSVAAPTAGLHFTEAVLRDLKKQGIDTRFLTLHVGAGTFRPVKSERLAGHHMHEEQVAVDREVIEAILEAVREGRPVIPVGTTSLRTLESLYWWGAEGIRNSEVGSRKWGREKGEKKTSDARRQMPDEEQEAGSGERFRKDSVPELEQWVPYEREGTLPAEEALETLLSILDQEDRDKWRGKTRLLIAPGYRFRLARGLITNFHQPRSTLLLLIAAMIGEDWRRVYDYALAEDFRFLSYGDSSLLLP